MSLAMLIKCRLLHCTDLWTAPFVLIGCTLQLYNYITTVFDHHPTHAAPLFNDPSDTRRGKVHCEPSVLGASLIVCWSGAAHVNKLGNVTRVQSKEETSNPDVTSFSDDGSTLQCWHAPRSPSNPKQVPKPKQAVTYIHTHTQVQWLQSWKAHSKWKHCPWSASSIV